LTLSAKPKAWNISIVRVLMPSALPLMMLRGMRSMIIVSMSGNCATNVSTVVSVERPFAGGSHTLFERDFRVEELPDGFLDRPVEEVVSFDPATRTVTFAVGEQRVEYHLPPMGK